MNDAASPTVPTLHGGCLCGKVRYTVAAEKLEGYYCHCRMCQLAFGNTRVPFLNVPKDHVHWHGQRATYASSKIAMRGFCGTCGTPLSFEYNGSERMDLSVGSLDHPGRVTPLSHFAVETRVENWHADDGLPGRRLDANQTILSRWREAYGEDAAPGLEVARGSP